MGHANKRKMGRRPWPEFIRGSPINLAVSFFLPSTSWIFPRMWQCDERLKTKTDKTKNQNWSRSVLVFSLSHCHIRSFYRHFKNTYSPITLKNFIFRCSSSPSNPVYPRCVDFSGLVVKESCLLWIKKERVKDKTYIWVSVWWKTKN
jgi:hypothetical protein